MCICNYSLEVRVLAWEVGDPDSNQSSAWIQSSLSSQITMHQAEHWLESGSSQASTLTLWTISLLLKRLSFHYHTGFDKNAGNVLSSSCAEEQEKYFFKKIGETPKQIPPFCVQILAQGLGQFLICLKRLSNPFL